MWPDIINNIIAWYVTYGVDNVEREGTLGFDPLSIDEVLILYIRSLLENVHSMMIVYLCVSVNLRLLTVLEKCLLVAWESIDTRFK